MTTTPLNDALKDCALALYKPPFKFHHGYFYDAAGNMVADKHEIDSMRVRGWGRISYKDNAEALQDAVGAMIAEAITEYWNTRANTPDSAAQGAMCNEKISLWFFRDLTNEQRIKLFGVFGFDSNELATANHGLQRKLLKSILGAQSSDATAQPIDLTDEHLEEIAEPFHKYSHDGSEYHFDRIGFARALLANTAQGKPDHIVDANKMVPTEPSAAMLDAAVAFALNVSLHSGYGWTDYMRDLWKVMMQANQREAHISHNSAHNDAAKKG